MKNTIQIFVTLIFMSTIASCHHVQSDHDIPKQIRMTDREVSTIVSANENVGIKKTNNTNNLAITLCILDLLFLG